MMYISYWQIILFIAGMIYVTWQMEKRFAHAIKKLEDRVNKIDASVDIIIREMDYSQIRFGDCEMDINRLKRETGIINMDGGEESEEEEGIN